MKGDEATAQPRTASAADLETILDCYETNMMETVFLRGPARFREHFDRPTARGGR